MSRLLEVRVVCNVVLYNAYLLLVNVCWLNKANVIRTAVTAAIPTVIEILVLLLRIPLCTAASPLLGVGLLGTVGDVGGGDLKFGYDAKMTFPDSSVFNIGLCFGLSPEGRLIIALII